METERGYLAIKDHSEIEFAGDKTNVSLADEPTNIMWEGHESESEQRKKTQVIKIFLTVFFTIALIIGINYGVTAWIKTVTNTYESRCFGDIVSETEFDERETSIGCFCE